MFPLEGLPPDLLNLFEAYFVEHCQLEEQHALRLVCKRWKERVELYGGCDFCREGVHIAISYSVSCARSGFGGGGGSESNTVEAELYPLANSKRITSTSRRYYDYCSWQSRHEKTKATIEVPQAKRLALIAEVEGLLKKQTQPKMTLTRKAEPLDSDFANAFEMDDPFERAEWEETLDISMPSKRLSLNFENEGSGSESEGEAAVESGSCKEEVLQVKDTILSAISCIKDKEPFENSEDESAEESESEDEKEVEEEEDVVHSAPNPGKRKRT